MTSHFEPEVAKHSKVSCHNNNFGVCEPIASHR